MFSLCIPTMDRFDSFLNGYLKKYLSYDIIDEIIITDENGNDVNKIKNAFPNEPKLKLYINESRLGPFLNKMKVCSLASNEWIALMDSDNFADQNYFIAAKDYLERNNLQQQKNVILSPCEASPRFIYSHLSGFIYKKGNFKENNLKESQNKKPNHCGSNVLMNTGNYILNKFLIDNIDLSKEQENIKKSSACDVIYLNTLLFEQLDLHFHVVPNMKYDHVVHNGSIYTQTHKQFEKFNLEVYRRYDALY